SLASPPSGGAFVGRFCSACSPATMRGAERLPRHTESRTPPTPQRRRRPDDGKRDDSQFSCCEGEPLAHDHWITWSARPSTDGGIVGPRAFASLRFMTNSNLVGRSTGRSAGLAPLRILSTEGAGPRNWGEKFTP